MSYFNLNVRPGLFDANNIEMEDKTKKKFKMSIGCRSELVFLIYFYLTYRIVAGIWALDGLKTTHDFKDLSLGQNLFMISYGVEQ